MTRQDILAWQPQTIVGHYYRYLVAASDDAGVIHATRPETEEQWIDVCEMYLRGGE